MQPDPGVLRGLLLACLGGSVCLGVLGALGAVLFAFRRRAAQTKAEQDQRRPLNETVLELAPVEAYLEVIPASTDEVAGGPTEIVLIAETTRFGRDKSMCDVTFDHPSVSRLHAHITRMAEGVYMLYDEGSTSGAWVNYKPVSGVGTVLAAGDLVNFGKVQLRFRLRTAPARADEPPAPAPVTKADPYATLPFDVPSGAPDKTRVRPETAAAEPASRVRSEHSAGTGEAG